MAVNVLTGKVEDKNIQGRFLVTYVNYHKTIHTLYSNDRASLISK